MVGDTGALGALLRNVSECVEFIEISFLNSMALKDSVGEEACDARLHTTSPVKAEKAIHGFLTAT